MSFVVQWIYKIFILFLMFCFVFLFFVICMIEMIWIISGSFFEVWPWGGFLFFSLCLLCGLLVWGICRMYERIYCEKYRYFMCLCQGAFGVQSTFALTWIVVVNHISDRQDIQGAWIGIFEGVHGGAFIVFLLLVMMECFDLCFKKIIEY